MKEDYMAALRFVEITPAKRYEIDQRPATLLEKVRYWFHSRGYWVRELKITTYREVSLATPEYYRAPY